MKQIRFSKAIFTTKIHEFVIKSKILACLFLTFSVSNSSFCQTEDFSKYLPEVREVNKVVSGFPELDISTIEKLLKFRAMPSNPSKTTLTPQNKIMGKVRVRIFRPDTIKAVVMEIHGGGWCLGTLEGNDKQNDELARTCQVAVVSIDYRLTPENAYPACVDDCETVLAYLLNNSKSEFGTDKIILTGESAGAHLAVTALLRLKNKQVNIKNVRGLNLFYGVYDISQTPSSRQITSNSIMLTKNVLAQFYSWAFPNKNSEQLRDPSFSPLYDNLQNLPPAFFSVGALDPLLDDSKFMASRWESAGNKAILTVYPECPHNFNRFNTQMANIANAKVYDWINSLIK